MPNSPTRSSLYGGCLDPAILAEEERIVWKDEPSTYPYLRETVVDRPSRSQAIRIPARRVIGYAVVKKAPPYSERWYRRRVWYVSPQDPYSEHGHVGWPIEAVWPGSVVAGQPSSGPTDAEHRAAHAARREAAD